MDKPIALITGIAGQDGSYLAELLLGKGYEVHGLIRPNSNQHLRENISHIQHHLQLHEGDLDDGPALTQLLLHVKPHEVYNLAAQSHVQTSFRLPEYTADTNCLGALRILDAVNLLNGMGHPVRFYQAGSSEMFGEVPHSPQNEQTPFRPRNPYGVSKVFAYWMTVNYRHTYALHASNGILFNHESPRRGGQFVTRKITSQTARVLAGLQPTVQLGNLEARRDWGHSRDYVEGMWLMLQQPEPGDYVLASGVSTTVRELCEKVAHWHGVSLDWCGAGFEEKGLDSRTGKVIFESVPELYRPCDDDQLVGDPSLAREKLGWKPQTSFDELVGEMCRQDAELLKTQAH